MNTIILGFCHPESDENILNIEKIGGTLLPF